MRLCARRSTATGWASKGMPPAVGDRSGSRRGISKPLISAREITTGSIEVVAGSRCELAPGARCGTWTSIAGNGRRRRAAAEPASSAGAHATSASEAPSTMEAAAPTAMKAAAATAVIGERRDRRASKQNGNG
ncbi:MAG: hypothetical protein WCA19_12230 [Candidatus Acidiferrales bacterium]